jgi:AraC-like DNA-binding protein
VRERERGGTVLEEPVPGQPIDAAIGYIAKSLFDHRLAPSAVARHVGLGPWQFCRKFRAITGMTCSEFIARWRMLEARRLLEREDLLVKEVAYRVGFEDANYFSRKFKSVVGTSPTRYRSGSNGDPARTPGENA